MVYGNQKEVELKSQEVKLGAGDKLAKILTTSKKSIKEIDTALKDLNKADNVIKNAVQNAEKINSKAQKAKDDANKLLPKIISAIEGVDKLAKDLGLSPSKIPNYSEVEDLFDELENKAREVNSFTFNN